MADVTPDYLAVMGMPLVAGHIFDETSASRSEVIVSRSLAEHLWGEANPIGRRFRNARPIAVAKDWMTVIGVVSDVTENLLQADPPPQIYLPVESAVRATQLTLVLRLRSHHAGATAALERFAAAMNPSNSPPIARLVIGDGIRLTLWGTGLHRIV